MEMSLREILLVAIQLVLFGLLLAFILYIGGVSRDFLTVNNDNRAFKQEMEVRRDLSTYDSKLVTSDDVLLAVKKYTKVYNVWIIPDKTKSTTWADSYRLLLDRDMEEPNWALEGYRVKDANGNPLYWEEGLVHRLNTVNGLYGDYIAVQLPQGKIIQENLGITSADKTRIDGFISSYRSRYGEEEMTGLLFVRK